jgi:membrane-associated protease RseP (regulator of RpoE activity)
LNEVIVTVVRAGKPEDIRLQPAPRPGDRRLAPGEDNFLGVRVSAQRDPAGFRVEEVLVEDPARYALQPGDLLREVRSDKTPAIALSPERPLGEQIDIASSTPMTFRVQRGEKPEILSLTMQPRMNPVFGRPMIGLEYGLDSKVTEIVKGSLADRHWGGQIKPGSRVPAILISDDLRSTTIVLATPDGGIEEHIFETPEAILADPVAAGLTGQLPLALAPAREVLPAPNLGAALVAGAERWLDMSVLIYKVIHRLLTRQMPVETLGGPVLLFRSIQGASEIGFLYLVYLVAAISVNLGICNLLPIPVLDGGHLLFLLVQWIKGSPPNARVREISQYVGIVCLLALLLTVTWFDLKQLFA